MRAKIKGKKVIAGGTLEVTYDLLGEKADFLPGQYFFVTLPKLRYPDQRGNKRHFSIINSPNEKGILSMATRQTGSGFKRSLQEAEVGSEVEVGPISGTFILPDNINRSLTFIAGGIGITPFMSMIRYIQEERLPYHFRLIYSNKDRASTVFLEELENISKQNPNFRLILTMTQDESWEGEKRRIDTQFIEDYTSGLNDAFYYVAGPPLVVESVTKALLSVGIIQENIKAENFSGY